MRRLHKLDFQGNGMSEKLFILSFFWNGKYLKTELPERALETCLKRLRKLDFHTNGMSWKPIHPFLWDGKALKNVWGVRAPAYLPSEDETKVGSILVHYQLISLLNIKGEDLSYPPLIIGFLHKPCIGPSPSDNKNEEDILFLLLLLCEIMEWRALLSLRIRQPLSLRVQQEGDPFHSPLRKKKYLRSVLS